MKSRLLANDGEWVAVLRRDLPGASLFNLATRAYSHDVDFVEASRVHDILIIEYPTLILCSDSKALVYNVAGPQASLLKAIIFEGFPPERVICNQDFFANIKPSCAGECAVTIVKKSSLLADEVGKRIVYLEKAHSHYCEHEHHLPFLCQGDRKKL